MTSPGKFFVGNCSVWCCARNFLTARSLSGRPLSVLVRGQAAATGEHTSASVDLSGATLAPPPTAPTVAAIIAIRAAARARCGSSRRWITVPFRLRRVPDGGYAGGAGVGWMAVSNCGPLDPSQRARVERRDTQAWEMPHSPRWKGCGGDVGRRSEGGTPRPPGWRRQEAVLCNEYPPPAARPGEESGPSTPAAKPLSHIQPASSCLVKGIAVRYQTKEGICG